MAQRHPDTPVPLARPAATADAGAALSAHLATQAAEFLRALRLRTEDEAAAAPALRAAARRIGATLYTFEPLVDPVWAEGLRTELGWLGTILSREHRYAARLTRLNTALHRLAADPGTAGGTMAVGAARAGALLERQLTLARTRAHSATLQAFGSARFHAVADAVALLASDLPLTANAAVPAAQALEPLAERAYRTLLDAAETLPLTEAACPYNTHALYATLTDAADGDLVGDPQDLPWHRVRMLARTCRYALEIPGAGGSLTGPSEGGHLVTLHGAGRALERHRDAADAAAAAATAARTPRITPATAYALGVLHADQRAEVEAARYAFSRLWQPAAPAAAP